METHTDEILGLVSGTEYDLLLTKLVGTRGNRVFSFFEIEAPQRSAKAQLAAQKATSKTGGAGGTTAMLEKKKRKKGGSGPGGSKRIKLLDFLSSSPLRSAGDSEGDRGKGSPATAAPPPIAAPPLSVIAPGAKLPPTLEYSTMEPDSDDELALQIQSALAVAEQRGNTSPAAPSSSKSTSSGSSSSSSGEDVVGRGLGSEGRASTSSVGAKLPNLGLPVRPVEGPRPLLRRRAAATM